MVRSAARQVPIALPVALGLAFGALACGNPARLDDPRPSVLLVVLDTVRADAVSAYGAVAGTTPHLDRLAEEGLRFSHAQAPAPWTLPSHATLFTGQGPDDHGVGLDGRGELREELPTLAEWLSAAGYETIGFSENPIVSRMFGMDRGFDHFEGQFEIDLVNRDKPAEAAFRFDVVKAATGWAAQRDPEKPFFLFVNLFDAHDPYEGDPQHRFLPPGTDPQAAAALGRGPRGEGVAEFAGICDRLPPPDDLAVLRGLYLGDVARADTKLGALHAHLAGASGERPLITIVTSDHGELLGERRLLGHQFSLHAGVLDVPLVVHGLDAPPAIIAAPVGIEDIAPSILVWAGVDAPAGLAGEPMPTTSDAPGPRDLFALWSDQRLASPDGTDVDDHLEGRRAGCRPDDRVFGDMLSVTRHPFKLVWYSDHPAELFDRSWDREERSDVAVHHPDEVARLREAVDGFRERLERLPEAEPVGPEAEEALRALGYLD